VYEHSLVNRYARTGQQGQREKQRLRGEERWSSPVLGGKSKGADCNVHHRRQSFDQRRLHNGPISRGSDINWPSFSWQESLSCIARRSRTSSVACCSILLESITEGGRRGDGRSKCEKGRTSYSLLCCAVCTSKGVSGEGGRYPNSDLVLSSITRNTEGSAFLQKP